MSKLLVVLGLVACGKPAATKHSTLDQGKVAAGGQKAEAASAVGTRDLVITWDERTGTAASSFQIYGQESAQSAEVPLMTLNAGKDGFDPTNPTAILHESDAAVKAFLGKKLCLSVTATVDGRESGPSKLACVHL